MGLSVKIDHFLWPSPAVSVQVQTAGKTEGLPFWFYCVCHRPQIFNIRQVGGYRSTQAASCAPIHHTLPCLSSANCQRLRWEAGRLQRRKAGLHKRLATLYMKVDKKAEQQKFHLVITDLK